MINGRRVLEARDNTRKEVIQDEEDLVVTGADVEGLYHNLSDIEFAQICFAGLNVFPGLLVGPPTLKCGCN